MMPMTNPITKLPSQFAGNGGKFNWWGFAIVSLSVGVMIFQIIDITKNWRIAKAEKAQEDKIEKIQIELAELKTLHKDDMPSMRQGTAQPKESFSFLSHLPTMSKHKIHAKPSGYRGFAEN